MAPASGGPAPEFCPAGQSQRARGLPRATPPPLTGRNCECRDLQTLLDHDNHEHRERMKEFMRDDLFVPCAPPYRCSLPVAQAPRLRRSNEAPRIRPWTRGRSLTGVGQGPTSCGHARCHLSRGIAHNVVSSSVLLDTVPCQTALWRMRREYDIDLRKEREVALQRLQALCRAGFVSVLDFRRDPLRIFAAHECAAMCGDGSLGTKMTVQFNLFGGSVLKLGTERHHGKFLRRVDMIEDVGCFALTELGCVSLRVAPFAATAPELISCCCCSCCIENSQGMAACVWAGQRLI
jgi:hypothetical protein